MLDDSTFESSEGFGGVLGTQFGNRRSTAAGGRPAFLPHPELQDDWMLGSVREVIVRPISCNVE